MQEQTTDLPDLNKTPVTLAVTEHAAAWLRGIGCKAIETEVMVAKGWLADLAAFWVPTPTEAKRQKLYGSAKIYDNAAERAAYLEIPFPVTVIIEVKTSRADYSRDKKWMLPKVADLQVLSFVRGVHGPEHIPAGWWGLEHAPDGQVWKVHRNFTVAAPSGIRDKDRLGLVAALADRMHNRHANAFFTNLAKRQRLEDAQHRRQDRFSDCMNAVLDILHANKESVEECLRWQTRGVKLPDYQMDRLRKLFGVLATKGT